MIESAAMHEARKAVMRAIANRYGIMASESADVDAMKLPYKELARRRYTELIAALDVLVAQARADALRAYRDQGAGRNPANTAFTRMTIDEHVDAAEAELAAALKRRDG